MSEENGSWVPTAGDSVKGIVMDIKSADGGYGPYPLLVVDTGGNELAVHAFHTVLRGELAKRRPKIGDEIGITYIGKVPTKNGKSEYHSYRVTGGSATGAYDWSQDLPPGSVPVEPDIPTDLPPVTAAAVPEPDTSGLPF